MAGLNRESIFASLATRISSAVPCSRRFRDISQVRGEEQPIAFLVQGDEQPVQERGALTKWALDASVFVYARTDDPTAAPSSVLNPILTSLEGALQWQPGDAPQLGMGSPTTLGGLVSSCRILRTERGEGVADGQAVAILHLQITATTN